MLGPDDGSLGGELVVESCRESGHAQIGARLDAGVLLARLGTLAESVGTAPDLVTVHRSLRDFVRAISPTHGIFVSRYDPKRAERIAVYAWSEGEELDVSTLPPMPMSESPHSRAVATGEVVIKDDLQSALVGQPVVNVSLDRDPRLPQSTLAAPMSIFGRVIGGFEVQSVHGAAYGDEDVPAMRMAANLAAIATENVRLLGEERRQRELAEASETRLHDLVQGIEAIVFEIDPATSTVTFVSRQVEQILGASVDSLVGDVGRWIELVHPEDRPLAQRGFRAAIAEARELDIEVRALSASDRIVWLHIVVRTSPDASGEARLRGVAVDVSERRRLEEQLLSAQKMEAIGQLAGGIAHDFNNLLTAIFGSAEILLAELPASDPRLRDAEAIRDAAERGATLVRQLLAFGRRQRLEPVVVDLNAVVGDILPMLQRLVGSRIAIRTVLADDLGRVSADPGQLQQVLINLVINARDAMDSSGELTIETANVELDAGYARLHPGVVAGPYVLLAVNDTGHGIDPTALPRVFEPFFSTKPAGEGGGLGLATVHGIVKQSGGHIAAHSVDGVGSTFRVYLPHRPEAGGPVGSARPRPQATVAPGPAGGSETVLLVEDDDQVRILAERVLGRLGYRVIAEPSGQAAVAWLEADETPIDLLLTDVMMPGMSGPEVAEAVQRLRPSVKILYVSGFVGGLAGADSEVRETRPFLQKPFSSPELARAVRDVLDGAA
jgi:two-component system, cell cycle sensor histidine kinase and response regulator CckA